MLGKGDWVFEKMVNHFPEDDIQTKQKVRTLVYINLMTMGIATVLAGIMLLTGAWVVASFCGLELLFGGLIMLLLQNGRHRLASHIYIILLFLVMFAAIKFDAYVSVYETYVLATLGLTLLIITSLVSFSKWQIVAVAVAAAAGILGLWWIDIFPTYAMKLDLLQIQNLATSILMLILGAAAGISLVNIQENSLFATREDRDRIKRMLSMTEIYTKKSLVSIIAEGKDPTQFVPIEANRVILFCDIRNFTSMAEGMNSIDIVGFLNSFFSRMNKEIQSHNGEIDKLIGDCIMASFESIDAAQQCAVQMQRHLQYYNRERMDFGLTPIAAGIGISFGSVVIGNIGSDSKMDFTSIGDVVNASSRIESLTKIYGVNILCSMAPEPDSPLQPWCRFIDNIRVKGKRDVISIYEIFEHEPDHVRNFKIKNATRYQAAWKLYSEGRFEEAEWHFGELIAEAGPHSHKPGVSLDPVLDHFRNRCCSLGRLGDHRHGRDEWDGVFSF